MQLRFGQNPFPQAFSLQAIAVQPYTKIVLAYDKEFCAHSLRLVTELDGQTLQTDVYRFVNESTELMEHEVTLKDG